VLWIRRDRPRSSPTPPWHRGKRSEPPPARSSNPRAAAVDVVSSCISGKAPHVPRGAPLPIGLEQHPHLSAQQIAGDRGSSVLRCMLWRRVVWVCASASSDESAIILGQRRDDRQWLHAGHARRIKGASRIPSQEGEHGCDRLAVGVPRSPCTIGRCDTPTPSRSGVRIVVETGCRSPSPSE